MCPEACLPRHEVEDDIDGEVGGDGPVDRPQRRVICTHGHRRT